MNYEKNLNIKYDVDVFVAGGGAAGVAAAVAAARQGKTVFLAESQGCFGGLGTAGLVPAFAPFDDGVNCLADGIGMEIRKNVSKEFPLNSYWTTIHVDELKREYDRIITEAGVKFSFFTTLYDVITEDGKITHVILGSKSGLFALKAKVYIDCTGDGDLCAFGGGEFEYGDQNGTVMPQTLCSLWANISKDRIKQPYHKYVEEAYKEGIFTLEDRHVPGFFHSDNGIGGGNFGHTFNKNPVDEVSLTEIMLEGRQLITEYEKYFKKYFKGYENMTLVTSANMPGVRESRRIKCKYTLNVNDFINRSVFDDEIGRYCYPVDIHVKSTDKEEFEKFWQEYTKDLHYAKGESYGIPYRSLVPVSFSNVLVAGRCIGTDLKMQASVRVMPGCFITGQAAGVAAALACDTLDTGKISITELKDRLKKLGAYLPNA